MRSTYIRIDKDLADDLLVDVTVRGDNHGNKLRHFDVLLVFHAALYRDFDIGEHLPVGAGKALHLDLLCVDERLAYHVIVLEVEETLATVVIREAIHKFM
jgi:hypothetical protein